MWHRLTRPGSTRSSARDRRRRLTGLAAVAALTLTGSTLVLPTAFADETDPTPSVEQTVDETATDPAQSESTTTDTTDPAAPDAASDPTPTEPAPTDPADDPAEASEPAADPEELEADQSAAPTASAPQPSAADAADQPAAAAADEPIFGPLALPSSDFWPDPYTVTSDPTGNADSTVFSGGSAENAPAGWSFDASASAPQSVDIGDVYTGGAVIGGDVWVYTGINRLARQGTGGFYLELNQEVPGVNGNDVAVPTRTVGDLRILFPFQGGNFQSQTIQIWNGTGWDTATLPAGSYQTQSSTDQLFSEFKFNISAIFAENDVTIGCQTQGFSNVMVRSSSSMTDNSELKDFVSGGISIQLCAELVIEKTDLEGNLLGGATFTVSPHPETGSEQEPLEVTDNGTADCDPADGVIKLCGINPGEYTVTETAAPAGYLLPPAANREQTLTVEAAGSVTFEFEDPKPFAPLTVELAVEASYDRTFTWDIAKTSDAEDTEVVVGDEPATIGYEVTVTPSAPADSGWALEGTLTVGNTNATAVTATIEAPCPFVGVTDADPATAGIQVSVPNGGATYTYECTGEPAELTGTHEASVSWSLVDYPQLQADVDAGANAGSASVSDEAEYAYTATLAGNSVEVLDDQTDPANPQSLGTVTVNADGDVQPGTGYTVDTDANSAVFEYDLDLTAPLGQCQTYTNTATVLEESASETVEVCSGADLSVTKTAAMTYDREYFWSIEKDGPADITVAADEATTNLAYSVTVAPGEFEDTNTQVGGTITIENPNTWQDVTVTLTDEVSLDGSVCTPTGTDADPETAGFQVEIPRGTADAAGTLTLPYTCTTPTATVTYAGTNTATITWDAEQYSTPSGADSQQVDIVVTEGAALNETVTVTDPMAPAGTFTEVTWNADGTATSFDYSVTVEGTPGECQTIDNTATLSTGQDAEHSVVVCVEYAPLTVETTAEATFDRTFTWGIEKSSDATDPVTTAGDAAATVGYEVAVAPSSPIDSGWVIEGSVEVGNPNASAVVATIELASADPQCAFVDDLDIDATADGIQIEVPAGGATYDFDCATDTEPAETGTVTATLEWSTLADPDAEGDVDVPAGTATASDAVEYAFGPATVSNTSADVYDDKTVAGEAQLLGTVTIDDEGVVQPGDGYEVDGNVAIFAYDLQLTAPLGQCMTYTNTATVFEQEASVDVQVCSGADLTIAKSAALVYDREYLWTIDKSGPADITLGADETSTEVTYEVTVTPGAFVDTGIQLGGLIAIENPNAWQDVTVTVTDEVDFGEIVCTPTGTDADEAADGFQVVVPAGVVDGDAVTPGIAIVAYGCEGTTEMGAYEGTNTATIAWDAEQYSTPTGSDSDTVDIEVTENSALNETVTVVDPMAPEGTFTPVTWNADGTPTVFTYTVTVEGAVGECSAIDNTATLSDGQSADHSFGLCVDEPAPVPPAPGPVPPAPPVDVPLASTGADAGPLLGWAVGLIAAGALVLFAGTRRKRA